MSLSLTLSRNKKVKPYISKKIHKLITFKIWVECDVNPLFGFNLYLVILISLHINFLYGLKYKLTRMSTQFLLNK